MPNYLAQFLKDPQAPGSMSVAGRMDPSVAWDYNRPMLAEALKGAWTAAQDPQTWRDAAHAYGDALLAGSVAPGMKGIRAFHGSPYDFDKFSLSKIGTGEGAQAYGRGLYFAGNEATARNYRDALSPGMLNTMAGPMDTSYWNGPQKAAADALHTASGDYAKASEILNALQGGMRDDALFALGELKRQKATPAGKMYEVNLAVAPEQLLDWDKPLSQQPRKTNKVLQKTGYPVSNIEAMMNGDYKSYPIGDEVTGIPRILSDPERVAALRKAGIPGIQYLDAGSRGAGEGSRNYVIFDDTLVKIIRKYGLAPLLMGGGVAASDQ